MPLFASSNVSVSAAIDHITDTAGASANADERTRALRSLGAAFRHFNNVSNWEFLLTEANPIPVVAPFTVTGITASGGAVTASAGAGHGIEPDDFIVGSFFRVGTRVLTTAASSFVINVAMTGTAGTATADVSANRDRYDLPSDFGKVYTARLLAAQRTLRPVRRRGWDRGTTDEFLNSTTYWYDIFPIGVRGKIGLLWPVNAADTLLLRYYRRMTVPTTTAGNLDIPQDYDDYAVAWGKWHYLTDKGDGKRDQATVWFQVAEQGLLRMKQEQAVEPDETLTITPDAFAGEPNIGPNSRWFSSYEYGR